MHTNRAFEIARQGKPFVESQRVQAIKALRAFANNPHAHQVAPEAAASARRAARELTALGDINKR